MKKVFILIILFFVIFFSAVKVNAEDDVGAPRGESSGGTTPPVTLTDPLHLNNAQNAPQILIGRIISAILGIVGSLALAMFIYGGFVWMTAAGSSEKVTKGRDIIIWATLGLVVIFSAYAMVKFVLTGLGVR